MFEVILKTRLYREEAELATKCLSTVGDILKHATDMI
jgi:hypothetical protein